MKRRNSILKKLTEAGIIAILLLGLVLIAPPEAKAINASGALAVIQPKNVYDIGEEINLQLVIYSDKSFDVEGQFFADGASIQAGSIADFRPATGLFYGINAANGWNFVIRVKLTSAGTKTFRFTATCSSKDPNELTATSQASASVSVRVRTAEERAQAEAAWAAEQERIRQEAARQASIDASIAESRAVEISIAASIDESIKESIYEEESIQASIDESVAESESEVERTRPSEIGEATYVKYMLPDENGDGGDHKYLYLLIRDNTIRLPENFREVDFSVNENEILALKAGGLDRNVYLVYGMTEDGTKPEFFYLNTETGEYFPYAYLNSDWVDDGPAGTSESSEESDSESEETEASDEGSAGRETAPEKGRSDGSFTDFENLKRLIAIAGFSFLLGAAIATLIAVLVKGKKAKAKREKREKPVKEEKTADRSGEIVETGTIEFEEIEDADGDTLAGKQEIDD